MTLQLRTSVATRVRGLAAEQQVKQTEIAKALHLTKMAVSRRMRGDTSFTAEEIFTLSEFLQVPIASLFTSSSAASSGDAA